MVEALCDTLEKRSTKYNRYLKSLRYLIICVEAVYKHNQDIIRQFFYRWIKAKKHSRENKGLMSSEINLVVVAHAFYCKNLVKEYFRAWIAITKKQKLQLQQQLSMMCFQDTHSL